VKIGRDFHVDGGLRQNTPMSPAIRLGADRLLVVSLRHVPSQTEQVVQRPEHERAYPKPLYLAGRALNSLLLDPTDYDLERMDRLNGILTAGVAAFGPRFEEMLNHEMIERRGAPIRPLVAARVRPSQDIAEIANHFVRTDKAELRGRWARRAFRLLAGGEAERESNILSYLLFDGSYCGALTELGYADAAAEEEALASVFSRDVVAERTA
jgi:NTE family protein